MFYVVFKKEALLTTLLTNGFSLPHFHFTDYFTTRYNKAINQMKRTKWSRDIFIRYNGGY